MKKFILILLIPIFCSCVNTRVAQEYERIELINDLEDLKEFISEDVFNERIDTNLAQSYIEVIDNRLLTLYKK
tara:strand:- start:52109 stop:52327 length:219 start_codon:yes stop_codon:yes gene_type:complete